MQQAAVATYQDTFVLVVILCFVVAPLVFFLWARRADESAKMILVRPEQLR